MNLRFNNVTYNLFYLFVCIVWAPVQMYYLKIDGAALTIFMLSIVALILNLPILFGKKGSLRSPIFKCWLVLVLYSFLNSLVKGFEAPTGPMIYLRANFITPLVFLIITIITLDKDKYRCLKTILAAQILYILMGIFHFTITGRDDRLLAEGLGNLLPLMSVSAVFVAGVLFCEDKLKRGWLFFFFIVILAMFATVASATRKAFGAIVLMVVGVLIGKNKKLVPRTLLLTSIALVTIYIGFNWVMDNTFMGERFLNNEQYDFVLSKNARVNDFLIKVLGDRSLFYYYGIQIFKQHPITGIGLTNFISVTQINVRIHSEYIVQLCENGIIGFGLLMLFYGLILKRLKKKRKERTNYMVYLFGLLAILFINLTAWTYNMNYTMIVYAVLINYTYSSSNYEISNTSPQRQLQ